MERPLSGEDPYNHYQNKKQSCQTRLKAKLLELIWARPIRASASGKMIEFKSSPTTKVTGPLHPTWPSLNLRG
jgi:hypothetical protein